MRVVVVVVNVGEGRALRVRGHGVRWYQPTIPQEARSCYRDRLWRDRDKQANGAVHARHTPTQLKPAPVGYEVYIARTKEEGTIQRADLGVIEKERLPKPKWAKEPPTPRNSAREV